MQVDPENPDRFLRLQDMGILGPHDCLQRLADHEGGEDGCMRPLETFTLIKSRIALETDIDMNARAIKRESLAATRTRSVLV